MKKVSPPSGHLLRLSPSLVLILALVVLPILGVVAASFSSVSGYELSLPVTLKNYSKIVTTGDPPIYLVILLRSFLIAILVTLLTVLISYPAAYFLAFHTGSAKYALLLVITVPFWTSYLLRVFSWKVILGHGGLLNSGLMTAGLIEQPLDVFMYNPVSVVISLTHAWVPFAVMPLFVSLEKIDKTLLEAASDLGLSRAAIFYRVVLPLSWPGIVAAGCLVFLPTISDYVTPSQVGGSSGLMIGNVVQSLFGRADDPALGAAISIATMATATIIVLVIWRLFGGGKIGHVE